MNSLARILFCLDAAIIALFFLSLGLSDRPDIINLDGEQNLGAWWGGAKLMVAAAAVSAVPLFASANRVASSSLYWVVAVGLAYLSADEILALHEEITGWNKSHDIGLPMVRGANGAWISMYAALCAALLLAFLRPVVAATKADPKSAALVAGGFAVWILGAVVIEVMGYFGLLGGMGSPSQVVIEESLELFGVSILMLGCVRHAVSALHGQRPT